MKKHGDLQWYHAMIPSIILHGIVIYLVIFDVLGIDLHIFPTIHPLNRIETTPVSLYAWAPVTIFTETPSSVEITAVSEDENIFETEDLQEPPVPELHFSIPEESDTQPIPETITQESDNPPVISASDQNLPASDSTVLGNETGSGETHVIAPENAHGTGHVQTQITASSPGDEKTPPKPNTSATAWKNYTKQLSQHFKSHKHYPEIAQKLRQTGTVWISVEISKDGKILSVTVSESSGYPILDQAALQSAKSADPVPPFPPETTESVKTVKIPYHYSIK